MNLLHAAIIVCGLISGPLHARAQDDAQRSEAVVTGIRPEGVWLGPDNYAIRPVLGSLAFRGSQRFAYGLMGEVDVVNSSWITAGPSVGVIYSSLLGTISGSQDYFEGFTTFNAGNLIQFPANLKISFARDVLPRVRPFVHGGANIIRSPKNQFGSFGDTPSVAGAESGDSAWDAHPNAGGGIEIGINERTDLGLRSDVTFMSAFNLYTFGLGVGLKL